MSFEAKRRVVWVGWIVLAVWPLVHHVLVRATDMHPQEGFAWSMYCVPSRSIGTRETTLDGRALPVEGLSAQTRRNLERTRGHYLQVRAALGNRAAPRSLARAVFEAFPELDAVRIDVHQAGVERRSAKIEYESRDQYEYRRDEILGGS